MLNRQLLLSGGLEPTYSVIIHQDIGGTITATPNEKSSMVVELMYMEPLPVHHIS